MMVYESNQKFKKAPNHKTNPVIFDRSPKGRAAQHAEPTKYGPLAGKSNELLCNLLIN